MTDPTPVPLEASSDHWRDAPERGRALRQVFLALALLLAVLVSSAVSVEILIEEAIAQAQVSTELYTDTSNEVESRKADVRGLTSKASDIERTAVINALKVARDTQHQLLAQRVRDDNRASRLKRSWVLWSVVAAALLVPAIVWVVAQWLEARHLYESRVQLASVEEEANRRGEQTARDSGADRMGTAALWVENRTRIEGYHHLVTDWAATSRNIAKLVLGFGFSFLVATIAIAVWASTLGAAVATSLVGTAGAILSGYVANAVLRNAEASSREVQAFFNHPLRLERILRAEYLVEQLPEHARAQT